MQLKTRELIAFALLSIPLSMGGLPLGLYLTPYYTAEMGVSLTAVGVILLLTRVTDVVTDPLIGTLSDRTPERYGRRSLWIMIGIPVMGLATVAVFDPPGQVSHYYLFLAVATLYLGWTLIGIPLSAWAAEISPDYHERSRITGARTVAGTSGTLMVLLLPMALALLVQNGYPSLAPVREGSLQPMLRLVAWGTVILLCICGPLLFLIVPQPKFAQKTSLDLRLALKLVWQNKPFMRLMLTGAMTSIGWYCIATLYVFFLSYYLHATTEQWSTLLLIYIGCSLIGTPVIVRLSRRFDKHRLLAALSMFAMVIFSAVLFFDEDDLGYYLYIQIFAGLVANAGAVLVPSMAADVIDQDTLETGQQRGALYMAMWGMADKLALAVAAGLTLPLLEFFGFDPTIQNDAGGLRALHIIYCLVPLCFLVLAAALIWNFPITRERQEEFRKKISLSGVRLD
jgi:GPH family glycoside/pentoside/hexuronide:cation symporter